VKKRHVAKGGKSSRFCAFITLGYRKWDFWWGTANLNLSLTEIASKQQKKSRKIAYAGPETIKLCAL
jgi:hypothetical protein